MWCFGLELWRNRLTSVPVIGCLASCKTTFHSWTVGWWLFDLPNWRLSFFLCRCGPQSAGRLPLCRTPSHQCQCSMLMSVRETFARVATRWKIIFCAGISSKTRSRLSKTGVGWPATPGKATCCGLSTGPMEPAASMVVGRLILRPTRERELSVQSCRFCAPHSSCDGALSESNECLTLGSPPSPDNLERASRWKDCRARPTRRL